MDVRISFPKQGLIQVEGNLFADATSTPCQQFLACVFEAGDIEQVTVAGGRVPRALLRYNPQKSSAQEVLGKIPQ